MEASLIKDESVHFDHIVIDFQSHRGGVQKQTVKNCHWPRTVSVSF